jgi:hypothetical protein
MKFNKNPSRNISKRNEDKVTISSEYYENIKPSYICSICNQTLVKLTDAGGNNNTYWCRNCSVEWNPTQEIIRRESKLSVPDRNIEPAVASVVFNPDITIKHTPPLRGGFAELAKKGTIKITDYHTTEKERRHHQVKSCKLQISLSLSQRG